MKWFSDLFGKEGASEGAHEQRLLQEAEEWPSECVTCFSESFGPTISYFSILLEGSLFYFCKKKSHQAAKTRVRERQEGKVV